MYHSYFICISFQGSLILTLATQVRFGQIKKKLGFQTATPSAARVRPGKRGADTDSPVAAALPAEKKQRKTPARSRAKKQPASSSAPASSPIAPENESPLAAKSAKKAYHKNIAPIPSGLNDGDSYAVAGKPGDGYAPSLLGTAGTGNGAATTEPSNGNMETRHALKTIIKPESDSDEEEEQNSHAKAELYDQITQKQIRSGREATIEREQQQEAYDNRAFGPPNNFPQVDMFAPLDAQQIQATAQQARTPLPDAARQVRNAAAQQAMAAASQTQATTASNASVCQAHNGGQHVTTIQAHQQALATAQPIGDQHAAQEVEVEEDMTLAADGLPGVDHDDELSAFNAAMYGAGGNGSLFQWPSF
jgi:hypothetical protein